MFHLLCWRTMVTCALSHAATLCAHPVLACKSIQHHAPALSPCKCRAQGAMSWRQRNQNSSNRLCPAWHVFMQTRPNYPTCPWSGWASLFMQHINATWPHAHHTLLNLGMGGAMLSGYVIGGCILSRLPAHCGPCDDGESRGGITTPLSGAGAFSLSSFQAHAPC